MRPKAGKIKSFAREYRACINESYTIYNQIFYILSTFFDKKGLKRKTGRLWFLQRRKLSKKLKNSYLPTELKYEKIRIDEDITRYREDLENYTNSGRIFSGVEGYSRDGHRVIYPEGLYLFINNFVERYRMNLAMRIERLKEMINDLASIMGASKDEDLNRMREDIVKFGNLTEKLTLIGKRIDKLESEINKYIDAQGEIDKKYFYERRFSFRLELDKISNLRGKVTLNLVYTHKTNEEDARLQQFYIYNASASEFFSYSQKLIVSAIEYVLSKAEDLFKDIYGTDINLNINLYVVPSLAKGYIGPVEKKFRSGNKEAFVEIFNTYNHLRISIGLRELLELMESKASDKEKSTALAVTLIHELNHLFHKSISREAYRQLEEGFGDEGIAVFSEFVYSPEQIETVYIYDIVEKCMKRPIKERMQMTIALGQHFEYILGFYMCLVMFLKDVRNKKLGDIDLTNLFSIRDAFLDKETSKNAKLFIRKLRQYDTETFFKEYFKACKELELEPIFDEEFIRKDLSIRVYVSKD